VNLHPYNLLPNYHDDNDNASLGNIEPDEDCNDSPEKYLTWMSDKSDSEEDDENQVILHIK
jgi:hypothetical protein